MVRLYYTISSVFTGQVIDIKGSGSGAELHSQKYVPGNDQHYWEFAVPIVGFPPGWFQIQNVGTGHLLSQNYPWNPPILFPPPSPQKASQHRETWGFQWCLVHEGSAANSWRIINRLTGQLLSPRFSRVDSPRTLAAYDEDREWSLQPDPSRNWIIKSRVTSFLLERGSYNSGGGTAVTCHDSKFALNGGKKSWILGYVCITIPRPLGLFLRLESVS